MASSASTISKIFCFIVLVGMAALQLQFALRQQEIFVGKSAEDKVLASRDARLLTNLAKEKHLFEADLDQAVLLLQKALFANPFFVPAWLALAEVRNDQGQKAGSRQIMAYTHHLTADIKRWRWDKVLAAYQIGQSELLPTELSYIINEIPGKSRRSALQLAFSVWPEPADLVDNLGQENLIHLFTHAYQTKDTGKTLYFYHLIDELGLEIEGTQLLRSIDMLLRNGHAAEAGAIWRNKVNSGFLLYNGDFTLPPTQTAFGWRRLKHASVSQTLERARGEPENKVLHIRFKGWENLKYHHFYQIVPLEPGKSFRFEARVRTDKLTTNQRPFFEIYGYECDSFSYRKTEMFPPSSDWRTVTLDFTVPEDCSTAIVRLRRLESDHIDSKISGNLWISDAAIIEVEKQFLEQVPIQ